MVACGAKDITVLSKEEVTAKKLEEAFKP